MLHSAGMWNSSNRSSSASSATSLSQSTVQASEPNSQLPLWVQLDTTCAGVHCRLENVCGDAEDTLRAGSSTCKPCSQGQKTPLLCPYHGLASHYSRPRVHSQGWPVVGFDSVDLNAMHAASCEAASAGKDGRQLSIHNELSDLLFMPAFCSIRPLSQSDVGSLTTCT